jgi:DNA invertase Pin-like site-specific DNA recombinase
MPGALPIETEQAGPPLRAAQYVRMSTDIQRYSTTNQADVIAAYARSRNIAIVRTYADEGLSGLSIQWRGGLKSLIEDVEGGRADFGCVLVYDVSRWGRFQDVDESAYYEFICKRAGIIVHYCADEFENDGSLASVILKNVKRVGAADFSRQLSKKVFLGQSRMVRMGFWRGGMPGYGLRRQLVEESGAIRQTLEYGQQKYLHTDRIRIVHGPDAEIETVRRIFNAVAREGRQLGDIASELNAAQIFTTRGGRWSAETIGKIVANEAYIGSIIFNRSSTKLKARRIENPREMWIRHDGAFPPVVDEALFRKAQHVLQSRRERRSDQEAIDRLAALGREKGSLSEAIIAAVDGIQSAESYRRRFGSLVKAYALAGYQPDPHQRRAETTARYHDRVDALVESIVSRINALGGSAILEQRCGIIRLEDGCSIAVGSARAVTDGARRVRWTIHARREVKAELTLILRMNASNTKATCCYLLPTSDLAGTKGKVIRITNPIFAQACRYEDVDLFCRLCAGLI